MNFGIDYWLNRVSMYRLMSISLGVLWGCSLALSLLGLLPFSPLEMIVSAFVLIMMAYLANLLFGRLFGVVTHDESSFITALILFFIFTPTIQLAGIVTLGLVAVIAMASKFILAVHGRHIFNPAGVAAVIAGVSGLAYASWWVATPVLLAVTLVAVVLVLYKTRRQAMSLVFLGLAAPLIVLLQISYGASFLEAVTMLASWPLLFFVGIMLSEPLTLPAKRWQQIVEAAVVAILFVVPLHFGGLTMTPALALIVGNLLAFILTRRRKIELTFKERRTLTPSSEEYVFKTNRTIPFEPGQYAEITIPHEHKDGRGLRRSFSVTSAPGENDLKFGIKFYEPSSSFKQALRRLESGSVIHATGISGDFTPPKNPSVPLLYIAGGIGITPFISHLQHLKVINQARDIILIYSVANIDELGYVDVLQNAGIRVYVVTTKGEMTIDNWTVLHEPFISKDLLATSVPDIARRHVYISGPPAMIRTVRTQLKDFKVKKLSTDYFTGY
jgi:ferredoxin-NADP reductase